MRHRQRVQGITVDASRARDLDDAFWVERTPSGYRLTAAVADVASLVPIGTLDDDLAASRGLTVYSGTAPKEPMFGVHIAHGLASLLPGRDRAAVACTIDFDRHGGLIGQDFMRATIRSSAKLGYEAFDDIYYRGEDPLASMVDVAVELAQILFRQRVAITGLPEWEAAFDLNGELREDASYGTVAQTVVHEFMVATNACATELVRAHGLPMIYRNQGPRMGGPTGRYEIVSHGHASLGKPSYGQFTSPIRRYIDLVNQRILCAAVEGRNSPYDIPQLAHICAASNRAAQRAEGLSRASTSASPTGTPSQTTNSGPPIARLDSAGFRNVVEQAGGFDPQTRVELRRRMANGLLTHSDIAWLLFGQDNHDETDIKREVLQKLTGNPEEMARIWECAFNEQGVPMFEAQVQAHAGRWIAAAAVESHVGDAIASDPARARGLAIIRLAAEIAGLDEPLEIQPPGTGLRLTDMLSKTKLVALCRLMNWDGPEYVVEAQGTGARHHYSGTAQVRVDTFDYETPIIHASTRRAAEMAAATLALAALDPYADELLLQEARDFGVDLSSLDSDDARDRPLNALSDFCRRYRAQHRIVWLSERPSLNRFDCVVEVTADGNKLHARGGGRTRTSAMEAAAEAVIASILNYGHDHRQSYERPEVAAAEAREFAPSA